MAGDVNRAAQRVTEIILLVFRSRTRPIKIILCVEKIIAHELVHVSVKGVRSGLELRLHRSGGISSVFRAVVGGQNADFGNGVDAGENVQRVVAAVVHVIAAVHFPVVVFSTASVHRKDCVAGDPHGSFILSGLVVHSRGQCYKLRKIAAIQLQLRDFSPGEHSADLG